MEKYLTNNSVLVTGSNGYVGKATEKVLIEHGYTVVGFDKNNNRDSRNIIKLFYFLSKKPKAIIHLSAKKSIPESMSNPLSYYLNNTLSTFCIGIVSRIFNVPVVFASSAAVYNPYNPYAKSKLAEEKFLKLICKKVVILRYFNIVGKSYGIMDEQGGNIFSIINKNPKIKINSASSTRDYVHVLDIAKANVLSIKYLQDNDFLITDIFSGNQFNMIDLVNEYRSNGINVEYTILDLPDLTVLPEIDNRDLLEWSTSYTFSDGIKSEVFFK
jgi:UDP-glucose 4-epimerase